MDLINLAQKRNKWQVVVNTVINSWIPKRQGISQLYEELLTSEKGLLCGVGPLGNGYTLERGNVCKK